MKPQLPSQDLIALNSNTVREKSVELEIVKFFFVTNAGEINAMKQALNWETGGGGGQFGRKLGGGGGGKQLRGGEEGKEGGRTGCGGEMR